MEGETRPLRLLSLDGGGVRGLSCIMILKHIMGQVNEKRREAGKNDIEPWEFFDMIRGTSTGGIIAIMLGRLRMSLKDCEGAYLQLSEQIFTPKYPSQGPFSWFPFGKGKDFLQANGRFDHKALENAVKERIKMSNFDENVLLKDEDSKCRVFVVAVRQNNTEPAIMRSYKLLGAAESLLHECKAWEACRATSAATTFFDPITIGSKGQVFIDGGILYNNPVRLVHQEAEQLWPDRDCLLISIGTGEPPSKAFKGNVVNIINGLKSIATETELTADQFYQSHKDIVEDKRYYRFNVTHGLATIGLEEWSQVSLIADSTETYLDRGETKKKFEECVERLLELEHQVSLPIAQRKRLIEQDAEDRLKIIQWLSPLDSFQKQTDVFGKFQEGTGQWLLDSPAYTKWISSTDMVLWCPGIPGAGKTTLVSMLVDHLRKEFGPKNEVGVACVYCDYNMVQTKQQSAENLLGSLWRDLAINKGPLSNVVEDIYMKSKGRNSRPSLENVSTALNFEISKYSQVFIILDALDELPEGKARRDLLDKLLALPPNAKLMITTRPHLNVRQYAKKNARSTSIRVTQLEVRATDSDLRTFLEGQMGEFQDFVTQDQDLQKRIINTIISCTEGMFLLARLHVDSLAPQHTLRDLEEALEKLPRGADVLNKTYNNAMTRIKEQNSSDREAAMKVLSWILFARRPLTVCEVKHSLAVRLNDCELISTGIRNDDQLVACCASLVTIDRSSGIIRLVHPTTKAYFMNIQDTGLLDAQFNIATVCLTYLLFDTFAEGPCSDDLAMEERMQQNVLLQYAAQYWGEHAHARKEFKGLIQDLALEFFEAAPNLSCAVQAMHISESRKSGYSQIYPREVQGLWVAAYFGLAEIIRLLLARGADWTVVTSYGESALHIASRNGHIDVIQLLMAEKSVGVDARNKCGETELHVAAAGGHADVVELLLNSGADVNAQTQTGYSALCLASENGHVAVVKLLLRKEADILIEDQNGAIALDQASWHGHEEVVQELLLLMLERPMDMRHFARFNLALGTHLCKVAARGNRHDRRNVDAMLKNGAHVEGAFDDHGYTGLGSAARAGNLEMVKVFLKNGVDIDVRSISGETPLHHAAKAGQENVVLHLLKHGASVSARDTFFGHTAISLASAMRHKVVEQILLENGANPLDAGMQVDPRALWGNNEYVSESDRVKGLMSQGESGRTSDDLQLDTVRKLVEGGDNINRASENGWTALHNAASKGNANAMAYLLNHQAYVDARDNDGITPLHLSCINNHESTALLLIRAGASLEARMERVDGTTDKSGGTPLHWACISGSTSTVALLLKEGAHYEARTHWYRTPLHLAARFGHVDAAKLLLDKGANLESRRDTKETPLHFAVEEDQYDMVRFLLEKGADIEAQGDRGTPLHLAKRIEHTRIAELLQKAKDADWKEGFDSSLLASQ